MGNLLWVNMELYFVSESLQVISYICVCISYSTLGGGDNRYLNNILFSLLYCFTGLLTFSLPFRETRTRYCPICELWDKLMHFVVWDLSFSLSHRVYLSTLKVQAADSSKMFVSSVYQTTWCHILEDHNLKWILLFYYSYTSITFIFPGSMNFSQWPILGKIEVQGTVMAFSKVLTGVFIWLSLGKPKINRWDI